MRSGKSSLVPLPPYFLSGLRKRAFHVCISKYFTAKRPHLPKGQISLRTAGARSGKRILRGNFRSRPEGVYTYTERKRAEIEQKSRIKRRKPQVFNLSLLL